MPRPLKFVSIALAKCALKRTTPLKDEDSDCTVNVGLGGDVSAWRMDHEDIKAAARKLGDGRGKESRRCDFAIYQGDNRSDGKSHLVLVECKKQFRETEEELIDVHGQLTGGLRVLQHMSENSKEFDLLTPVFVYNHREDYGGAIRSRHVDALLQKHRVKYNRRTARIKMKRSEVEIDDKFVAI